LKEKAETGTAAIVRYHERSKHHPGRFAPGPGFMDWASQPDPFRMYEGAPILELPLAGDDLGATWDDLHAPGAVAARPLDRGSLGALLELALGLTAWKEVPGSRWALRANPSSGNLHPTEGYVLVPEVKGVPAGLYHYRSVDHVLERRFTPAVDGAARLARGLPGGAFLVGLASIHWREAWKYGERAFRYCQHDAGHALATVRYAAGVLGWSARLLEAPGDADVAVLLGLDREPDVEALANADREHPDALILVAPATVLGDAGWGLMGELDELVETMGQGEWTGRPNALSAAHAPWPEIDAAAEAVSKPRTTSADLTSSPPTPCGREEAAAAASAPVRATRLIRQRRSAVAMDGLTSVPATVFFAMMERLLPQPGVPPWDALPWAPRLHPVLFLHRVEGLAPGLYLFERDAAAHETLRESLRQDLRWQRPAGTPEALRLFLLEEGDARSFASLASCQQAIAAASRRASPKVPGGTAGSSGRPGSSDRSSTWRPRPRGSAARGSAATSTTWFTSCWVWVGSSSRISTTSRPGARSTTHVWRPVRPTPRRSTPASSPERPI
jgi:SagB-type dehydrogenase family enzyme